MFGPAGEPMRRETVTHSGTPIRITIPFYQVEVLVRDSFGAPVRGAKVDVLWGGGGRLLDSGTTGDDGRFTSGRIPVGLDVVVRASYGQHAVEEAATGRTAIEVRMPFVQIGWIAVEPLWRTNEFVTLGDRWPRTIISDQGRYQTMLEELFSKAQELKEKLAKMEREDFLDLLELAKRLWVPYKPQPIGSEHTVYAVDSSWNIRLYDGFYVYALRAAAVDEAQEVHHPVIEFDLMRRDMGGLTPENSVKLIAENAEHYIAELASREADLVLVDGSLIARLRSAEIMLRPGSAHAEYLSWVRSLRGRENVVFVSKYSQDSSLLNGDLGDIYYFRAATDEQGYALGPRWLRDGVPITTAYIRLADHMSPLKVEVPAEVGEDHVRRLVDVLAPRSVRGYPYALILAHRTVVVGDKLMEALCVTAGLTGLSRPREVLEI